MYIYIIYTPNLGSAIAVSVREREWAALEGAAREYGAATREQERVPWGSAETRQVGS